MVSTIAIAEDNEGTEHEDRALSAGPELFRALCGPRYLDRARQDFILTLPDDLREQHLRWLSGELWSFYKRFRFVPGTHLTKAQYGAAYALYIQVRHLLGPLGMRVRVWSQLDRRDLAHWKWFSEVRRARYRDRRAKSPKGKAALKAVAQKYNASDKGKERRRRYRQSQAKGFFKVAS